MLHAVIMAGGAGTRFWPASTAARPKQLLPLAGERTMIQATVDRLAGLVPPERMLIVTNERLVEPIRRQLPQLPAAAIVGEPAKRDTAPCIGLAAIIVSQHDADATMAVMPADHVIAPVAEFQAALKLAAELVEQSPTRIVTFGIQPNYPAEIFGYIERGARFSEETAHHSPLTTHHIYSVTRFREKPDRATAEKYLAAGNYYWNSGIFVWKARHILQQLAQHEPAMFAHLQRIAAAANSPEYNDVLRREFTSIDGKSIDYAVMERATEVVVIEAPFEWDDVGSWQSLARLRGADADGNTIAAKRHVGVNTGGSIISADANHLVVTVGVSDLIIVQVDNVTLVANRHDEESIREVVRTLKERGLDEYL
jgi:mannose-1-phosphate guanylyltransferase